MTISIPKIIMQTWKTNEVPDKWKASPLAIQKYMSDWKYVLMTDQDNRNFIEEHFPDFLSTYDNFPYNIQRADAIRYCWLYVHGGLYLDCDIEILGPLDPFFEQEGDLFLLASANTPDVITNSFMASKPQHPFWLEMIEEMKKPPGLSSLERHLLVMNTTGPMALNRLIKNSSHTYIPLPVEKLNPYNICTSCYDKPGAMVRPLEGSSWVGNIGQLYHWVFCQSQYLILIFAVGLLILAVGIAIFLNLFPS